MACGNGTFQKADGVQGFLCRVCLWKKGLSQAFLIAIALVPICFAHLWDETAPPVQPEVGSVWIRCIG